MPIPEHGLGRAINDRLRRAAAPKLAVDERTRHPPLTFDAEDGRNGSRVPPGGFVVSDRNANRYPIELTAPDIGPYRGGNVGIDYVHSFDSGQSGPHVMVCPLTHGNEICGAIALDFLFRRSEEHTSEL